MDFDSLQDDSALPKQPQAPVSIEETPQLSTQNISQPEAQQLPEPAHTDFDSLQDDSEKYGTGIEQAKAAAEGVAQGLVGPLAPLAEKALGVKEEDILGRQEANETTHYLGEMAGLVLPVVVSGGTSVAAKLAGLTQAGLMEKIAFEGGETLAGRIGATAAKSAIDNMLVAGSDEASRAILHDPNQSAESAIASIGMSGVIGGVLGGGVGIMGKVADSWKAANAHDTSKVLADFKARIKEHLENPEPVKAAQTELESLYNSIKEVPVFGEKGIKTEAIAKAMPQMSEKIRDHGYSILENATQKAEDALASDPHKPLLDSAIAKYKSVLETDDPHSIFSGAQELKQQLQEWGKYNKDMVPLGERAFRDVAKDLAFEIRSGLEDTKVWGKAAQIQKDINSSFSKFKPTLDDIEKTFTTKVGGERVFDPGKVNTYMNQLGKPSAEIKMQKVGNYLEQADKYKKAIADAYHSVGEDSPFEPLSLNTILGTLKEKTQGAKLADYVITKGLTEAGGKGAGAVTGAALGSLVGHAGIGALVGQHALGGFYSSILPGIAKAIVDGPASSTGFKAAVDYANAVAKGIKATNTATKAIFKAGSEVLPSHMYPSKADNEKLAKHVDQHIENPLAAADSQAHLTHYLPSNHSAMLMTRAAALNYLAQLKPGNQKQGILDSEHVPSSTEESKYTQALELVNQPLAILDKIKAGKVTPADLQTVGTVYPSLYNSLKAKLSNEMIEAVKNKQIIPYKTRLALSMFMAQPLDFTMQPMSIQAAQPIPQQAPAAQQSAPKGVKSSPALQKMPGLYQTPDQHREARRNK